MPKIGGNWLAAGCVLLGLGFGLTAQNTAWGQANGIPGSKPGAIPGFGNLPNTNQPMSMEDIMRLRYLQSRGSGRRGPQYGAPVFGGNFGPAMPAMPAAGGNQQQPQVNPAQAKQEHQKAIARARAEAIRAREREFLERRRATLKAEAEAQGLGKKDEQPKDQE